MTRGFYKSQPFVNKRKEPKGGFSAESKLLTRLVLVLVFHYIIIVILNISLFCNGLLIFIVQLAQILVNWLVIWFRETGVNSSRLDNSADAKIALC